MILFCNKKKPNKDELKKHNSKLLDNMLNIDTENSQTSLAQLV